MPENAAQECRITEYCAGNVYPGECPLGLLAARLCLIGQPLHRRPSDPTGERQQSVSGAAPTTAERLWCRWSAWPSPVELSRSIARRAGFIDRTPCGVLLHAVRLDGRRSAQARVDECGRLERRQVVGTLAEADQLDGHAQLPLHRDDDPALGGPVELGQD